jgi:hypothetical protein
MLLEDTVLDSVLIVADHRIGAVAQADREAVAAVDLVPGGRCRFNSQYILPVNIGIRLGIEGLLSVNGFAVDICD